MRSPSDAAGRGGQASPPPSSAGAPAAGFEPLPALRRSRHRLAWGVSLAVHVSALIAVLWLFERPPHDPIDDLEPLVFVEPAPPPPPPPLAAAADEEAGADAEAPLELQEVDVARLAEPAPTPPPTATRRPLARATATRVSVTATPRQSRIAAPAPGGGEAGRSAAEGGVAGGDPRGEVGGVVGGVEGGLVGGVVGGRGDQVLRADVAAKPPVVIERVLPEYPPPARARGMEGLVVLRAVVDRHGRVEDGVTVLESSPAFDEAAIAALRRWRFTPGRDNEGSAVRVQIDVPMRFQLK